MKIAALIVTYNRKDILLECITAVRKQTVKEMDIWVVDNASSDGTETQLQKIEETDSRVHSIYLKKNLGGAGGFSYGIRRLADKGYERIWLMDDDTIPEPKTLEALLEADALLEGNYGFLSSYVMWKDGNPCVMNRPQIEEEWINGISKLQQGLVPVSRATFVSMLLPLETVKRVGLPIREFFLWGDDWEYTDRISKNAESFLVLKSKVLHKTLENTGSDISSDSETRIERYFYSFRNEWYLARRNGIGSVLFYLYRLVGTVRTVLRGKERRKGRRIKTVLKGFFCGLFFYPQIEFLSIGRKDMHHENF